MFFAITRKKYLGNKSEAFKIPRKSSYFCKFKLAFAAPYKLML